MIICPRRTQEFSKLKSSTINAVLVENNYDYARSRARLTEKVSRSWRFSILSLLSRRLGQPSETNRLPPPSTGCPELDEEIAALHNDKAQLTRELNEEDDHPRPFECECCFGDVAWEDIAYCPELHFFCKTCLGRSLGEALYGGQRGAGGLVDVSTGRVNVRCISSVATCTATVSPSLLPYFLSEETMRALDDHVASILLDKSDVILLRCPFCSFAVSPPPVVEERWDGTFVGLFVWMWMTIWWYFGNRWFPAEVRRELDEVVLRRGRRRWEMMLCCLNPRCLRSSCLQCKQEWTGIHDCAKDQADSKRAHVARRMDEALKRTVWHPRVLGRNLPSLFSCSAQSVRRRS